MTNCKHILNRLTLFIIALFAVSISSFAQDSTAVAGGGGNAGIEEGRALYVGKCQACHSGDMKSNSTGPALGGVEAQWEDKGKLHEWIRNNVKLTASGYPKAVEVSKMTPLVMNTFDDLTDTQIDNILAYIDAKFTGALDAPADAAAGGAAAPKASEGQNNLIFGIITLILALVAVVLIFVNNSLTRVTREIENARPLPVLPVYRNKTYLAMAAILLFIVGGFFMTKALININRQTDYQPVQPIFYSHKVHAGINQISCLYCHGNGWESKTAAIPSTNMCMNCHKTIQKYNGEPLYDSHGNLVDGTTEIQKLYKYAGFDPQNAEAWDPEKAQPIPWVKIHNLPDHVYFNHAQHIRIGDVQCQTCHGEVTAMHEVKQFSELSMGWCVNCHRETKVNFNVDSTGGNRFYSIYEKFHNDIKAGRMDSVTVKDIGGLECQKCHY